MTSGGIIVVPSLLGISCPSAFVVVFVEGSIAVAIESAAIGDLTEGTATAAAVAAWTIVAGTTATVAAG